MIQVDAVELGHWFKHFAGDMLVLLKGQNYRGADKSHCDNSRDTLPNAAGGKAASTFWGPSADWPQED